MVYFFNKLKYINSNDSSLYNVVRVLVLYSKAKSNTALPNLFIHNTTDEKKTNKKTHKNIS